MKFDDGLVVRAQAGGLANLGTADLSAVRATLARHPIVEIVPLFTRPVPELEAERRRAEAASGRPQPDQTLFFVVRLGAGGSPAVLADELRALDPLENAYVSPAAAPPPGP